MKKELILLLLACLIAIFGAVNVSADEEEEEHPVIEIGKDLTRTYYEGDIPDEILFFPDNSDYQCYRITAEVREASSDSVYITASSGHDGATYGFGIGPEDHLTRSNPSASFWTFEFDKNGSNDITAEAVFPDEGQEDDDSDAFITVTWRIEKIIGLRDPHHNIKVNMKQTPYYYSGTGSLPKPEVTSVTVDGKKLQEGKDYRLSSILHYYNGYYFRIYGLGDYGDILEPSVTLTDKKQEGGQKDTSGQGGKATPAADKKAQPMKVSVAKKSVKASKLKKKAQTVKAITVKGARGALSYKITGGNAKSRKALKINKSTGKITVKKGSKKGTYQVKVTVAAAGNSQYKAGSKKVTVSVKVK